MRTIGAFLVREPASLGTFIAAAFALWVKSPEGTAVVIAGVGWMVRSLSSPKAAVDDAHATGYAAAIADVSSLTPPAGQIVPRDLPPPPIRDTRPL